MAAARHPTVRKIAFAFDNVNELHISLAIGGGPVACPCGMIGS